MKSMIINHIKLAAALLALLALSACGSGGSASSNPSAHRYEISVIYQPGIVDKSTEAATMESSGIEILQENNGVFIVMADDAAINRYIETGHWLQITGENVNIKQSVDYIPTKGTP